MGPSPVAGDLMKSASGEFADDPCSSVKRGNMVRAARALLSAVTRLLILADMADVYKLLVQLKVVSAGLSCAWHATLSLELSLTVAFLWSTEGWGTLSLSVQLMSVNATSRHCQ